MLKQNTADMTNPYIGTVSYLLQSTVPAVTLPYGMVKSYPIPLKNNDAYFNEHIKGFPAGYAVITPGRNGCFTPAADHSRENCHCYYSRLWLEPEEILVEMCTSPHVHLYRISGADELVISCEEGSITLREDRIHIQIPFNSSGGQFQQYVVLEFEGAGTLKVQNDENRISVPIGDSALCKAAVSYVSFDKALESLAKETKGKTFDSLVSEAAGIWNELLGRIEIEGNTKDKQIAFYTALYRSFERMTNYGEYGAYFGYNGESQEGEYFYTNDGLWDTFRCMHPLQLLLDGKRQEEILESYNLMYRQSGRMPSFPQFGSDAPIMIGFHAAALFADSLAKGLKADYKTAYEGIKKNALTQSMIPWCCNEEATPLDRCYYEQGFFPALEKGVKESEEKVNLFERRQSISVTLEHAYDDWCAARLAEHLGLTEDYELFMKRSENWRNLYHSELGYMAPKTRDGSWVTDFDPKWSGGAGGRDYTAENNSLVYTWFVPHAIEALIEQMGGREKAVSKLDQLFEEGFLTDKKNKYEFLVQFPDATGLMGQFSMGNEPAFHIPYLYDYLDCSWKTQKRLRDCMDIWFTNSPTGICGDEDGGAMSSWFVFSGLGFYPVCPGRAEYALGTPLFDKAVLKLENGKTFTVISQGAGDGLRYIQRALLNGKELTRPFLKHEDIINGGELILEMTDTPKK